MPFITISAIKELTLKNLQALRIKITTINKILMNDIYCCLCNKLIYTQFISSSLMYDLSYKNLQALRTKITTTNTILISCIYYFYLCNKRTYSQSFFINVRLKQSTGFKNQNNNYKHDSYTCHLLLYLQ